jgi:CheY-like chemotaxis protein
MALSGGASLMSTVMVVEDCQPAREVVMRILRREGYDVLGASNGNEAWDMLQHNARPDLMLLDVMMPEMDGMTLLSMMRERPETKEMPVILLTALSDEGRMSRARELGVREYLVKTRFSYDDLVSQVGRHVRH